MHKALVEVGKNRALRDFTEKQLKYLELYYGRKSPTRGNVMRSAIAAGFSKYYARTLTTNYRDLEWVKEAKLLLTRLEPEHIIGGLEHEASNSPYSRDRIRALELLGKLHGLFVDRAVYDVNVQFSNDVPRPKYVEGEAVTESK